MQSVTSPQKNSFIFCLIFLYIVTILSEKVSAQHKDKPNIIIIMADDLDSRQLSCYGGKNIVTPNIDALASSGLKFNNLIASEAMCIPTRASLFTGLYPARHGAYQNHKQVYDTLKSVCHYLGDVGYRVGITGKNHVTKPAKVFPFEIVPGFEPNCVATTDEYFLDSVRQFIDKKSPYCLFVMSINPHAPWTVGDASEFEPSKLKLPANWIDSKIIRERFASYLAEVRRLDNQVGDILKLVKKTGEENNTIVVFLGEQGPQFPGGKWTLWNYGQLSSMVIRWPGKIGANTVTNALIQYEDIMPTLVELGGGTQIQDIDGFSFVDILYNKAKEHRQFAYGIHNNIPEGPPYPIRSIRDKQYKLIWNLLPQTDYYIKYMMNPNQKNGYYYEWLEQAKNDKKAQFIVNRLTKRPEIEFYDLARDPDEMDNLASDPRYAARIARHKEELTQWMKDQRDKGIEMDIPFKRNGQK